MDIDMKSMVAVMGVAIIGSVMVAMITPPPPSYCCPICGLCFYTYDELYEHFVAGHPSEPIDIIWE